MNMSSTRKKRLMPLAGLFCFAANLAASEQAEQHDATTLDAVNVSAKFVAQGAKSAMKMDISVLETPYSVSSYGDAFMKAIETANITDLYNYMTGVRRGGYSGYDISIRGFKNTSDDRNSILVDGLPGVAGRFGSPPTFAAEGVEVVKGPASVLYGSAQPGGFVNIIRKKPQARSAALIDLRTSSYRGAGWSLGEQTGYAIGLDFTGPLDREQRLLYRLVTEYGDKDGFRLHSWDKAIYMAPSLTWNIGDASQFSAAFEYRKRKDSYETVQPWLVAPNKDARLIPDIRTRYQEKGDGSDETAHAASLTFNHYFHNGAILNLAYRGVKGEEERKGFDNVSVLADGVTMRRRARHQFNKRDYHFVDGNISLPFDTGAVEHRMLAGATYGVDTTDFSRLQYFNGPTTGPGSLPGPGRINVDLYNPVLGQVPPRESYPAGNSNRRYSRNATSGVYLSDLMSLSERWKLNLGLRYAKENRSFQERAPVVLARSKGSSSSVLPTAGLMFNPVPDWTVYASYATSYVPQLPTVQDAAGDPNPFDPQKGRQYEIGAKAELLDGRLTATLALFDIEKTNTVAQIACNSGVGGNCFQQIGAERSKGSEFEVNYQVSDNFQIIGGIAYTDAYISENWNSPTAPLVGAQLTNSALKMANLWARYDFTQGALRNFGIGFGASYNSEIAGSLPSASDGRVLILPAYTVADLALYYKMADRYQFTLKISNLFDEYYFDGVGSQNENGVIPGAPRNITLSLRVPLW